MRQKHGQNFLIDNNIANNIVRAAQLTTEDEIIEIGPGKGILTKIMQPSVKRLTAIEIDKNLFTSLNHYFTFHNAQNIDIINIDFLKYNIPDYPAVKPDYLGKFVSNLPYNVGTAIIQKILPLKNWKLCVFMLQKEVAGRLAAKQGTNDYGYISIFTQYYADAEILFDVSPKCFNPQPKVISSVIKLVNKISEVPDPLFFALVKQSFSMRRKTILNCLSSFKNLEKSQANKILITCNLDPLLRPDKLSISDYLRLTAEIKKCIIFQ
ncbi:MAG: 16S rRNA (adenine(1518)-N(6)/adenine(1519)-N(6))-dimethyltransferase RsmA [Endomicrobium sp.]|jgi:16S rRNA (adenine1518-N6/adenine1519-N6)-dimethyltransferase|nr:16S rRNA (adenine(1518)-N(6)/adenine(1519)-N(6))-dimethyltransferase RsmA [Endomicrobium sp.]